MIATFPMIADELSLFPGQRRVEAIINASPLSPEHCRAALACEKLFNLARFSVLAAALSWNRTLLASGIGTLRQLSLSVRDVVEDVSCKEDLWQQVQREAQTISASFESEDF